MKKIFYRKSTAIMRILTWLVIYALLMLPSGVAFAGNPPALSTVKIPSPPNLGDFVKDKKAAIQLGKALFWDMNTGGDGGQACASCHYRAGADPINAGPNGAPGPISAGNYPNEVNLRGTNQVNPGPNGNFDVRFPDQTLTVADFPFFTVSDPLQAKLKQDGSGNAVFDQATGTLRCDDVVGSQGVSFNIFTSLNPNNITPNNPLDLGTPQNDPKFGHSRRVTGRNTPPAVNAVFNYNNFWDGRANNIFNGSSPLGPLDGSAGIYVNLAGPTDAPVIQFQKVSIPNASTASQAVGPPNNNVEMSWDGRNFPQLGRKLLALAPLGQQIVSADDSALGPLSCQLASNASTTTCTLQGGKGINTTYAALIEQAFYEKYWDSFAPNINVNGANYSQMEANFSLFWGLSIMLYEATLVSDMTPFDLNAMNDTQKTGAGIFQSKCAMCHSGSEFSDATVSFALANGLIARGEILNNSAPISDNGYHNLGVSPTAADIGRGGVGGAPFLQNGFSIASFAQQAIAQANGGLLFTAPQAIFGGITANTPVAVNGSHKTPQIRNVALNAPYMHNGSMLTLAEVVDFYARGGNFANAEQAKDMSVPVGLGAADRAALVEFMQTAMTDPRVDAELAPFDHPQLFIPDGTSATLNDSNTDPKIELPATGGSLASYAFDLDTYIATRLCDACVETAALANLPKAEITGAPTGVTNQTTATITVGGANVVSFKYKMDSGVYSAETPTTTPIALTGLAGGAHTVFVVGKNAAGNWQLDANATTASWTIDAAQPAVTMDPVVSTTRDKNVTITGTAEAGCTLSVNAGPGVNAGPCTVTGGGAFTCQVSGMASGTNTITVTATDAAGNKNSVTTTVKVVVADGCFRGTGSPDITDALKALKMSVGIITPTSDDMLHGDVNTDNKIDTSDALLILRKSVGMASF